MFAKCNKAWKTPIWKRTWDLAPGQVSFNSKGWSRVGVWTGTLKNPTKWLWRWEPDRRFNFFFIPPAHRCAVTGMTEISLNVMLNSQFNSPHLGITIKMWPSVWYIKEPYERSMVWESYCRSNFLFSPHEHLCAVTCITLSNLYSWNCIWRKFKMFFWFLIEIFV